MTDSSTPSLAPELGLDPNPGKWAWKCEHTDRPHKALGLCQPCYRSIKGRTDRGDRRRAPEVEQLAQDVDSGRVKLDEETLVEQSTGAPVERDFSTDPEAVKEFYGIMWRWIREDDAAKEPIYYKNPKGEKIRDHRAEISKQQLTSARAMKAATVLGRAYIAERHVEEKPADLPVDGMGDILAGYMQVANMKKSKEGEQDG